MSGAATQALHRDFDSFGFGAKLGGRLSDGTGDSAAGVGLEFVMTPVIEPSGLIFGLDLWGRVGKDARDGLAALIGVGGVMDWSFYR